MSQAARESCYLSISIAEKRKFVVNSLRILPQGESEGKK
jgi:hypothetical protein